MSSLSDLFDIRSKSGCERLGQGRMREPKPGADEPSWIDAGARQQCFFCHLAKREAKRDRGCGKHSQAMDGPRQSPREFGIGYRFRSRQIDRAAERRHVGEKLEGRDGVLKADPTHPLPPGPERSSQPQAEQGEHPGKRTGFGVEDYPEAKMNDADARHDGRLRRGLPIAAKVGEKPAARTGILIQELVASVSIETGCGRCDKRNGRLAQAGENRSEGMG